MPQKHRAIEVLRLQCSMTMMLQVHLEVIAGLFLVTRMSLVDPSFQPRRQLIAHTVLHTLWMPLEISVKHRCHFSMVHAAGSTAHAVTDRSSRRRLSISGASLLLLLRSFWDAGRPCTSNHQSQARTIKHETTQSSRRRAVHPSTRPSRGGDLACG